ncbi:sugar phosphate isomerase/epimerase family protein [Acetobacter conturbans]|uniref:TIM barrel protein n=1 Tax=Acetobacter conturbans TaxID=1737472 RepID=A0ABX0K4L5_9PROT|nr:sugar phosphate isomerase/epimerase family protein [Acetobacter conturbans]NHN90195.1 TIM barrel protein [Acetobacter conturbans]
MEDVSRNNRGLALNTATLGHNIPGAGAGWSPERTIDACAERGINGIVFWRREIESSPARVGDYARAAGVHVIGLCRSPFLVGPLSLRNPLQITDDFHRSIDQAAELGAEVLTIVVGGVQPETKGVSESLKIVADYLSHAVPWAAAANVRLALEPLHPVYGGDRSCLTTTRDALNLCDIIDSDILGVAIDIYHVWWDTDLPHQIARAGNRIFGFHLCDWLAQTSDILLDRGMMGDGVADIHGISAAVRAAGYHGFSEVEIFSANNWWKRDPREVLDVMTKRFHTAC